MGNVGVNFSCEIQDPTTDILLTRRFESGWQKRTKAKYEGLSIYVG